MGFDEDDVEASSRRVEGHAGSGDAAADHQHVGHVPGQEVGQIPIPTLGVEIGGGDGHRHSLPGRR